MALMVTVHRAGREPRTEAALPGTRIFTQTSLLHNLLEWLDRGKTWADIDPEVRCFVAKDLRALADIIEPDTHPAQSSSSARYSPAYGTGRPPEPGGDTDPRRVRVVRSGADKGSLL